VAHKDSSNTYRSLWMLGLALTLPMILVSGPIAGYLISYWITLAWNDAPTHLTPALMVLGLIGSGLQTAKIIKKFSELNSKKESPS